MDDFVLNVRQIKQYPLKDVAEAADAILLQTGGLGGPYAYTTPAGLVGALKTAPVSFGSLTSSDLTTGMIELPVTGLVDWGSGTGSIVFDGTSFALTQGNAPVATLGPYGSWLHDGTWTVTRDPAAPLEVATMGWVQGVEDSLKAFTLDVAFKDSVRSWNGQRGDVKFGFEQMLQLGVAPIKNPSFKGQALLNLRPLATEQFVNNVFAERITLNNLICLGLAPLHSPPFVGRPTAPTPPVSDISNRLATTRFVHNWTDEFELQLDMRLDSSLHWLHQHLEDQIKPMVDAAIEAKLGDVEFATQDWVTTQLGNFVKKTGDTMTGDLFNTASFVLEGQQQWEWAWMTNAYGVVLSQRLKANHYIIGTPITVDNAFGIALNGQTIINGPTGIHSNVDVRTDNVTIDLIKLASGQYSRLKGALQTGGPALWRWTMDLGDAAAETGTNNQGSNFVIGRYADDGTFIDNPLTINRSTGLVTLKTVAPSTTGMALSLGTPMTPPIGTTGIFMSVDTAYGNALRIVSNNSSSQESYGIAITQGGNAGVGMSIVNAAALPNRNNIILNQAAAIAALQINCTGTATAAITTNGNVSLGNLLVNDGGTQKTVTFGDADSGGTGYKVLRIAN